MATKYLLRTAAFAALLLAASACIYPYEVDIKQGNSYPLVVEGDIHIGSTTILSLSHVRPFHDEEYAYTPIVARGYIEGEDGTRVDGVRPYADPVDPGYPGGGYIASGYGYASSYYPGYGSGAPTLIFDTGSLRGDQRYRLHFETVRPYVNTYESDWLEPCPAPTIDALSYSKNDEFEELWIGLSMHCHGSHYFRWTFSENWEYHSDLMTDLKYVPEERRVGHYYEYGEPNLYYCWNSASSSKINIFSTVNQIEDRFEKLSFHTIPLSDQRLQVLYRIRVRLEAMSENAYNYWVNIQQNSEGQGSIFAPTPSEMASNVHCISDPAVQVMGYLNAAVQADAEMYYDNAQNQFYKPGRPRNRDDHQVTNTPDSLAYWYRLGYLPYQEIYEGLSDKPSHHMWALNSCIDCRRLGGSKTKPDGWPDTHN